MVLPPGVIHYNYAFLGGRRDIDIIHADTGSGNPFELAGIGQHLGRHFGSASDDQPVVFADGLHQLIFAEPQANNRFHIVHCLQKVDTSCASLSLIRILNMFGIS